MTLREGWRFDPADTFNVYGGSGSIVASSAARYSSLRRNCRSVAERVRFELFGRFFVPAASATGEKGQILTAHRDPRSREPQLRQPLCHVSGRRRHDRGKTHNGGTLRLKKSNLESSISPSNGYMPYWLRDGNAGTNGVCRMNGFDTVPIGRTPGTYVYQYVDPRTKLRLYWDLAQQYVLSDHTFQTQRQRKFTAHQDLIRGGTEIAKDRSLIDFPTQAPWGCDAPPASSRR